MKNEDLLLESLKSFTLKKGEMKVIKGGKYTIKVYSSTGLLLYDIDNQVYYFPTGEVVSSTEACL